MELTGERFMPECQGEIAAEHYHRYFFAARLVTGKRVLDIASGEGYGAHILARSAAHVTGVDINPEVVASAAHRYGSDNISFLEGSAIAIPLPDASMDMVVSFETLEHLCEHEVMLHEIRRVLREDGLLIMSTPNRPIYSTLGPNEFHVRELCREELATLLKEYFTNFTILGQKIMYGSLLDGTKGSTLVVRQPGSDIEADIIPFVDSAMYYIAVAGNRTLPSIEVSFFEYPLEKSDFNKRYNALLNTHHALQKNYNMIQDRLKAAEAAYEGIIASRSWRIMAPLRRLRRFFGRTPDRR